MKKTISRLIVLLLICRLVPAAAQYEGTAPYCPIRGGVIINEISNGPLTGQNNNEYVELLVLPDPMAPSAPVDLSGWILDDNNVAQSGQGNAAGHFTLGECYAAVPPGSLLVIYNPSDRNPDLPADDPEDQNQDGVYIISADHACVQVCNSNPTTDDARYCPCSDPDLPAAAWQIGLRNSGDVFQIRDRCETVVQAISWGNVQLSPEVTDSPVHLRIGSDNQSERVIRLTHLLNDNWNDLLNYDNPQVDGNQTPGAPNNAANAAFIERLRNNNPPVCQGVIYDCQITDAGDLAPPDGGGDTPLTICQGTDLAAFNAVYDQPDESRPEAPGLVFEYAFLLTADDAPVFEILAFTLDGDFDFSILPPGNYRLWGYSYIQTNGSVSVTELLTNSVMSIQQLQGYFACGYDGDLDSLDRTGRLLEIQILETPQVFEPESPLSACGEDGQARFNLRLYDTIVNGGRDQDVTWFTDPEATQSIAVPTSYVSGPDTVYAQIVQDICPSPIVAVPLEISSGPEIRIEVEQNISCDTPRGAIRLITPAEPGLIIDWNVDQWDGADRLTDLSAGQYSVTVTDVDGCQQSSTIDLIGSGPLDADFAVVAPGCTGSADGEINLLFVTGGLPPYRISADGQTFEDSESWNLSGLTAGAYELTVADAEGCLLANTVVIAPPPPLFLDLGPDQEVAAGEAATVVVTSDFAISTLVWSPAAGVSPVAGTATYEIRPDTTTSYRALAIDDQGCTATDSLLISVLIEPIDSLAAGVYVPNAFSPNEDGINDIFTIYADDRVQSISSMRIFDRWGNLLYENSDLLPNDLRRGWRGDVRGQPLDEGVYVYFLELLFTDGRTMISRGEVTLIR